MAHTTIFTIFRQSRGVILLLMGIVLLVAAAMAFTGRQSVDAKEFTTDVPVTDVSVSTDTTSPRDQFICGPEPGPPNWPNACPDWNYWNELVASGWDGEQQWFYYCTFMLLCGRTSTIRCWVETE